MLEACIYMHECGESFDDMEQSLMVAHKTFECCECGQKIKRGSQYERSKGFFLDENERIIATEIFRTCMICSSIIRDFTTDGFRLFGTLWDEMQDVYGISSPDELPEWTEEEELHWRTLKQQEAGIIPKGIEL